MSHTPHGSGGLCASGRSFSGVGLGDIAEGIQEEMLAATQSFYRNAAVACAEVCMARLRQMQFQLQQNMELERRQMAATGIVSPLGVSRPLLPGLYSATDPKNLALIRNIRGRLDARGETAAHVLRAGSHGGIITRDEFVSLMSQLGVGASYAELADLFNSVPSVAGHGGDALVDEVAHLLESPTSLLSPPPSMLSTAATLSTPPEVDRVLGRVRSAVGRSGRAYDEVFRGFCRQGSPGVMNRSDLARVLTTFEPDIEPEIVARLWRAVVPEHAPGIDFHTFTLWFCPGGRPPNRPHAFDQSFPQPSPGGLGGTQMLEQLLDMSTSGALSPKSTAQQLSPTATMLPGHWQQIGIGAPPQAAATVTSAPLAQAWGSPAPIRKDETPLSAYLFRLGRGLKAKNQTVSSAFVLYDDALERSLSRERFVVACEDLKLPLSRNEAEALFHRMARPSEGGRPQKVTFDDLESNLKSLPDPFPEDQWARDLVSAIDKMARQNGSPLETMFRAQHRDAVAPAEIQATLSRYATLSPPMWSALAPLLEKQADGNIPWKNVLSWAGVSSAAAPAAAAAPAVPGAVAAASQPAVAPAAPAAAAKTVAPAAPAPVAPAVPAIAAASRPAVAPAAPVPAAPVPPGPAPVAPAAPAPAVAAPAPPLPAAPVPPGASASKPAIAPVAPVTPLSFTGVAKSPVAPVAPVAPLVAKPGTAVAPAAPLGIKPPVPFGGTSPAVAAAVAAPKPPLPGATPPPLPPGTPPVPGVASPVAPFAPVAPAAVKPMAPMSSPAPPLPGSAPKPPAAPLPGAAVKPVVPPLPGASSPAAPLPPPVPGVATPAAPTPPVPPVAPAVAAPAPPLPPGAPAAPSPPPPLPPAAAGLPLYRSPAPVPAPAVPVAVAAPASPPAPQVETAGPLWSTDYTYTLSSDRREVEELVGPECRMLDPDMISSVGRAVDGLNKGSIPCPEWCCIVYSKNSNGFFLLYKKGGNDVAVNLMDKPPGAATPPAPSPATPALPPPPVPAYAPVGGLPRPPIGAVVGSPVPPPRG